MESRNILPTLYMCIPKIIDPACTMMNQQHLKKHISDLIVTVTHCTIAILKGIYIYTTNSIIYYENTWIFGMDKSSYPFFSFLFAFFLFLPADRHYVIMTAFIRRLLEHNICTQRLSLTPTLHSDNYPVMAGVWRRSASNLNQTFTQ